MVFESEVFPRPHVGESLVPSSTRVFDELGFLPQMEAAGFPRKYGAAWTVSADVRTYSVDWEGLSPETGVDIRFGERDQPGVDQPYTYHVERGSFDLMLLQHAHRRGAHVYEGAAVKGVGLLRSGVRADPVRLERETFPREHVGESLFPYCYPILEELGVLDEMAERFVRKPGVRFVDTDGSTQTTWCFAHVIKGPSYLSFHVIRAEFDELLLDNAARHGAAVREGTRGWPSNSTSVVEGWRSERPA